MFCSNEIFKWFECTESNQWNKLDFLTFSSITVLIEHDPLIIARIDQLKVSLQIITVKNKNK